MRATGAFHRVGGGAGAFLTLLALGLLAPAPSLAGCDHPGDRPAISGDLFGLGLDRPAAPAPAPKPCSGPQCSGKSGLPPASATPQAPPRLESWAILALPTPDPRPDPSAPSPEDDRDFPARFAPSIFHPPRLPR